MDFAPQLISLLREHYAMLRPDVRKNLVQALMLLRSKKLLDQIQLLSLFFFLFRCHDKQLRSTLHTFIITDIKAANQKCKNNKLNRALQNFMFTMIIGESAASGTHGANAIQQQPGSGDASDIAAKCSLDICIELYRKNIWNDGKTVNIIAEALFSPHVKVMVAALKFFLGSNQQEEDGDSDAEDAPDISQIQYRNSITKKSKSKKSKLDRALKLVKKKEKKSGRAESFNFAALHMVNDPQGLAEKLFSRLSSKSCSGTTINAKGMVASRELKFDFKLMMMNLTSRLIGVHKLILLNFYHNLIRYVVWR